MDNLMMDKKNEFINLLRQTKREGIEELISWLESTDFFTAPASTMYHGAKEGGLLIHSLTVYAALKAIKHGLVNFDHLDDNSMIIVALLHDICKANCYTVDYRNVKVNGEWTKQPYYKFDEQFKFGGHGSKSMYLASKYIKLSDEEASAILNHMGAWDNSNYSNPGAAFEDNLLAFALHIADGMATYVAKA